jgi:hypothetical protein
MTKERWLRMTREEGLTITGDKRIRTAGKACLDL